MVTEFLLSAKHNNLYEAFVSEAKIPIADIGFDLTPMVEKGYSVGMLRLAETAWWFLFDCLKICLLYTSPSPRDGLLSRMPSSA